MEPSFAPFPGTSVGSQMGRSDLVSSSHSDMGCQGCKGPVNLLWHNASSGNYSTDNSKRLAKHYKIIFKVASRFPNAIDELLEIVVKDKSHHSLKKKNQ